MHPLRVMGVPLMHLNAQNAVGGPKSHQTSQINYGHLHLSDSNGVIESPSQVLGPPKLETGRCSEVPMRAPCDRWSFQAKERT